MWHMTKALKLMQTLLLVATMVQNKGRSVEHCQVEEDHYYYQHIIQ
jgi:hypothetical protein